MAWKLTIAGVDKTNMIDNGTGVKIAKTVNNRGQATFRVLPPYIPNCFDEVVIYEQDGVTPLYGGVIINRNVVDFYPGSTICWTDVTCADWWTYTDWCYTSRSYTSPVTLKQVLTDFVTDCLGAYGISLDPSQPTGPTLDPFDFNTTKLSDGIRSLTSSSNGFIGQITPGKVFSMVLPGSVSAPFSITDATPNCLTFSWTDSTYTPSNVVLLTCGVADFAFNDPQSFTANGIDNSWVFQVISSDPYTSDGGGGSIHVGGVVKHLSLGDFTWVEDSTLQTMTLTLPSVPALGTVIDFSRNVQPPFIYRVASGATPEIFSPASAPTATTVAAAKATANGLLTSLNQNPRTVTILTENSGLEPLQTLTISLSSRSFSAAATITEIDVVLISDSYWQYTVTAVEGSSFQGSALDQLRTLLGSGSSSSNITVSGGGGGSSINPPIGIGGSSEVAYETSVSFVPVPNAFRYLAPISGTYRLRAAGYARHSGVSVTFKLRDLTAGTDAITMSAFTSTSEVITTLDGILTAGHDYQLQIEGGTAAEGVFCTWATLQFVSA